MSDEHDHGYPPLPLPLPPPPEPPGPPPQNGTAVVRTDEPSERELLAAVLTEVGGIRRALEMFLALPPAHPAPPPPPTRELPLQALAAELREAAKALESSAAQLKDDGKGWRASHALQAARRAQKIADELLLGLYPGDHP